MEVAAVVEEAPVDDDAPVGASVGGGFLGCLGIRVGISFAATGCPGMYMVTGDAGQTIAQH